MSDTHGNHLHFYEGNAQFNDDIQKIVEETPSIAFGDDLREKICETAVQITKAVNYRGAGTVKFILDADGTFYFWK